MKNFSSSKFTDQILVEKFVEILTSINLKGKKICSSTEKTLNFNIRVPKVQGVTQLWNTDTFFR